MLRHMFVTLLIVASVYTSLLFVIGHPLVAVASPESKENTSIDSDGESSGHKNIEKKNASRAESDWRNLPSFHVGTILGVSQVVELQDDGVAVSQLWQDLLQNKTLVNRVDWQSGNVQVIAYYSDFNETMSKARVSIGFAASSFKRQPVTNSQTIGEISLPTGQYLHFPMDIDSETLSDKAWASAMLNDNLIERHTLNRDGERVTAAALVVLRKQQ